MTSSRLLAFCTLVAVAAAPGAALAQRTAADIESARQLYNEGIALRDKGDFKGALDKFKAAHALGNTPITGLELCKTHASVNQPVEAREVCLSVARIPPLAGETARSQEARSEAARVADEVKARIAGLRIRVTGVPAGWQPTVTVDGLAVPPAAIGQPRAVNPGVHTITARVGSGGETRATLELKEGESRDLDLAVQPPPADEPPPPVGPAPVGQGQPPPPKERKGSGLATVGFAVAGVGAAIGVVGGLVAISGKNELDDACPPAPNGTKTCGADDHDTLDSARTWGTVSTVSFVVAGVGLVAGLVGTLSSRSSTGAVSPPTRTAPAPRITPVLGLGGAGIHGTF